MPQHSYVDSTLARAIIETTSQPLLVLDDSLTILQSNNAFLEAFDVTREETDGYPLRDLGNGQWDIADLLNRLQSAATKGDVFREYRVEHTFDRIGRRVMLVNATPIVVDGKTDKILLAIADVTEREGLLSKLVGQKEFAEKVVDASRDALLVLGWDLRVKTANATFYSQFEVERDEVEGRLVYELGNGQWNIPKLRELLEEVLPENNAFDDFEVEHDFAAIGRRVMLLNARKIDHLQLILLAIEDISARRRAQIELRKSEERLRKVLETDAVGVIFFNADGLLIDCNESFLNLTGSARDDVQRKMLTWQKLTPPEWMQASEHQMALRERTGRIGPYEKEYLRKDGSRSWMIFAGRELDDGTIVEFCVDISDRKKAEQQRELLTRELSHRVKNTLAVVQALAMQTAVTAHSVEDYRTAFLGRLKALSRAQTLIIESEAQTSDVRSLVEDALSPYRETRPEVVAIDGDPTPVDGRKVVGLMLILHELATNAAKYGALSKETGRVDISWRAVPSGNSRRVDFTWREHDGPAIDAAISQGFGTNLIERASAMELGGRADLKFAPAGLVCNISFPAN